MLNKLGIKGKKGAEGDAPAGASDAEEKASSGKGAKLKIAIFAVVLAMVGAGVTWATANGHLDPVLEAAGIGPGAPSATKEDVGRNAYVREVEEIVIDLGPSAEADYLRAGFVIALTDSRENRGGEGGEGDLGAGDGMEYRVKEIATSYLRLLEESDFESPRAVRRIAREVKRRLAEAAPDGVEVRRVYVTDLVLK